MGGDVTVARIHHPDDWLAVLQGRRNERGGNKEGHRDECMN